MGYCMHMKETTPLTAARKNGDTKHSCTNMKYSRSRKKESNRKSQICKIGLRKPTGIQPKKKAIRNITG